jgi:hypothetical protein
MIDGGDFDLILLAEHRLGLPTLFYFKLMEVKDDWAFILKLHALFEGTLKRLLEEKQTQFEFTDPIIIDRDSFPTMLQTAARHFLLDEIGEPIVSARHYLRALYQLRNRIAHDLEFINLDLGRYVASLSEVEFQKAARSLAISYPDQPYQQAPKPLRKVIETAQKVLPPKHRTTTVREALFDVAPKPAIWSGGGRTLTALSHCLHIQPVGDSLGTDPRMAAKLQDLLHDPKVIELKRELSKESGIDIT